MPRRPLVGKHLLPVIDREQARLSGQCLPPLSREPIPELRRHKPEDEPSDALLAKALDETIAKRSAGLSLVRAQRGHGMREMQG